MAKQLMDIAYFTVKQADRYSPCYWDMEKLTNHLDPPSGTFLRQTDFDVTIGRCVVSDRNLACAVFLRRKTLSTR